MTIEASDSTDHGICNRMYDQKPFFRVSAKHHYTVTTAQEGQWKTDLSAFSPRAKTWFDCRHLRNRRATGGRAHCERARSYDLPAHNAVQLV